MSAIILLLILRDPSPGHARQHRAATLARSSGQYDVKLLRLDWALVGQAGRLEEDSVCHGADKTDRSLLSSFTWGAAVGFSDGALCICKVTRPYDSLQGQSRADPPPGRVAEMEMNDSSGG